MKNLYWISFLSLLALSMYGCVASSNFYTGRTLSPGRLAWTIGADDILNTASGSNRVHVGVSKNWPISFLPSLGFNVGLPLTLETGLRWYIPSGFLEGALRKELNPVSFTPFDASLDFSYAGYISEYSYARLGATVSKKLKWGEPFVSYSFYHEMGRVNSNLNLTYNGSTIVDVADTFVKGLNRARSFAFGIALPVGKTRIFPEIDAMYYTGTGPSNYLWSFGIGIQLGGM